jgi:hypothetical protein
MLQTLTPQGQPVEARRHIRQVNAHAPDDGVPVLWLPGSDQA